MKRIFIVLGLFIILLTVAVIDDNEISAKGVSTSSSASTTSSAARSASMNAARTASMNASRSAMLRSNINASASRNMSMRVNNQLYKPQMQKGVSMNSYRNQHFLFQNNTISYMVLINMSKDRLDAQKQKEIISRNSIEDESHTITVTIDGNERVYVVSKEIYDKVQEGSKVIIKNGKVELK